jgi:uncharacterized protein (TIGR02679 family)
MEEPGGLERLRRLLGGSELEPLRRRLRSRYERGEQGDGFTLVGLNAAERRVLEGLTGRSVRAAGSMRLRVSELDAALSRAGIAPSLRRALELLDGTIHDRKAQRQMLEQSWADALTRVGEPRLKALVSTPSGMALLKRLAGSDARGAQSLLTRCQRVLERLPERGMPLAQLAARMLGDAHALDPGSPVASLVLRASAEGATEQDHAERPREQWARLGVTVNELAAPALCLNLPVHPTDESAVSITLSAGEPVHLSLRKLLRDPPSWAVLDRDVFVCENPSIVAIAADRLGGSSAPLVCTDGMPSAAQRTLMSQLAAAGAHLRYHGDFDWPGLTIGNFIMRALGARPWRFTADDYLAACQGCASLLAAEGRIEAQWDPSLAGVMAERALTIHEEAVSDLLLEDLRAETHDMR